MFKHTLLTICAVAALVSPFTACDSSPDPGPDTDVTTSGTTGATSTGTGELIIEPRVSKAGPLMLDLLRAQRPTTEGDLLGIFEANAKADPVTFGLISGAGEPGDVVELQACSGQVCVSCSATFAVHISCKLTSPIGNCVGGCGIYGCAITCA